MSVPVGKRSVSEMEFYNSAVKLRVDLTRWLMRDFGIKDKVRSVEYFSKAHNLSEEDSKTLICILDKYRLGDRLTETYPEWWVDNRRDKVDRILADLVGYIVKANCIYPTSVQEFYERRILQDKAIECVSNLIEELQFILAVVYKTTGADVQKYLPYVELANKEIALLKGWRKADNKILQRLKKQ